MNTLSHTVSWLTSRTLFPIQLFWKSLWNIFDLTVLIFSVVTLVVLTATRPLSHTDDCQPDSWSEKEELLDLIMIIVRNVAQGVRLLFMLRKWVAIGPSAVTTR